MGQVCIFFFPHIHNVPQHLFSQTLASIFNVVLIQELSLFQNHIIFLDH